MATFFQALNFWVAVVALLVMISMIAYAQSSTRPDHVLNATKHPSVFAAFLLFGATYLLGILLGLPFILGSDPSARVSNFLHIFFNNAGSLCAFLSAAIYAQGKQFDIKNGILASLVSLVVFFVWAVAGAFAAGNTYLTLMAFAPVTLLSVAASVSLGWAFFARWHGIDGLIFLLITIVFALIEMAGFLMFALGSNPAQSEIATALVLIPRVLLAFAFISLACSSDNRAVEIDERRYWPKAAVIPRYRLTSLRGLISALAAPLPTVISLMDKLLGLCPALEVVGFCR